MPERVPRVVHDAVVVTRELGFRYLWIDRYCINQQDADTKHQQIRQMWSIYASAYITLIAAAGNGPNHGLPGVSLPRRQDREKRGAVTIADNSSIADEIRNSMWASRAWTFQENLASRRKIFFTDMGASYACEEYFKTDLGQKILQEAERLDEVLFDALRYSLGAAKSFIQGENNILLALRNIEAYCKRSLTYDSDSLNAIIGMLGSLSQSKVDPVDHVWGTLLFPVKTLSSVESYQLCLDWFHGSRTRRRNGYPTWSPLAWEGSSLYTLYHERPKPISCKASSDGPIRFDSAHKIYLLHEDGEINLDAYARSRRDAFGRIKAGVTATAAPTLLKFESARVLPLLSRIVDRTHFTTYHVAVQQPDTEDLLLDCHWDSEPHGPEAELIGIYLFEDRSGRINTMVLKPVRNYYERIGMAYLPAEDRSCAIWSEYTENIIVG
ncbi:hypothetical protein E8E13_000635 [Curvularia kusanoi]|uniref:Heterokaryon incompatibility domain-containing protein n=1 Tax=Curvularia kusanoi TaxID=90978 RepID=A0A9P4T423_CURKU|nr:hypothetical protein E8E13_000635 [Curvularia kusanoi]